jgi:hypothetical protein
MDIVVHHPAWMGALIVSAMRAVMLLVAAPAFRGPSGWDEITCLP